MKSFIYGVVIVILVLTIGFLIYKSAQSKNPSSSSNNTASNDSAGNQGSQPESLVSGDIIMKDAVATIYYGNGCPHCTKIEIWLQENKFLPAGDKIDQKTVDGWIDSAKIKFNMKEVWYNKTNSAELSTNATALGLSGQQVGVPFLYDSVNKKSYIGETDIQNFFSTK